VLHEHAASLSAATHANRSRRLIKCAKDSGHYQVFFSPGDNPMVFYEGVAISPGENDGRMAGL